MITTERRKEIERITQDLLINAYGSLDQIVPPIDLTNILKKYKTQISLAEFNQVDIAGTLKTLKTGHKILVSKSDSFQRQAFTIAHELGHIILHPELENDVYRNKDAYFFDEQTLEEQEANVFAAAILMPKEVMASIMTITHSETEIAEIFKVSVSACSYRLKHMHIE